MKTLEELFYEHHIEVGSEVSRVLQKVCVEYVEGVLEYCAEHEIEDKLAIARRFARGQEPTEPEVEGDWVVRDKEPL